MILPGEVYYAQMPSGPRPVIVVSREELNRGTYFLAVPCTTKNFETRRKLQNCVPFFTGQFGLTADCVAQCENVAPVNKQTDLASGPIGTLDEVTLRDVVKAIGYVIECDCEPI